MARARGDGGCGRRVVDRARPVLELWGPARADAVAHGLTAEIVYDRRYPVLVNTAEETIKAPKAAIAVAGEENVNTDHPPTMGSEDFAWMLQERPGCYIRVGNGEGEDGGCVVHNPHYDFNAQAAVYGASYWATLVEQELSPA